MPFTVGCAACAILVLGTAEAHARPGEPYPPQAHSVAEAHAIVGSILEDPDGDGDPSDATPLAGARVRLWLDGGDGEADGRDDRLVGETEALGGRFAFRGLPEATWWVTVDSRSLSPAGAWPEQTWSGPGGLCHATGGDARPLDGVCLGGRNGDRGDGQGLDGAEHVARVLTDRDHHDLAFAFSFVTVTRTLDRDEVPDARPFAQGSLRQAVDNARLRGGGVIRFVPLTRPAGGPGRSFHTITLGGDLALAAGTELDGTAWCDGVSCPVATVREEAGGLLGHGGVVGLGADGRPDSGDEALLPSVARPALELDGGGRHRLHLTGAASARDLALFRGGLSISGDGARAADLVVGPRADGTSTANSPLPALQLVGSPSDVRVVRSLLRSDADVVIGTVGGDVTLSDLEIAGDGERAVGVRLALGPRTRDLHLERLLVTSDGSAVRLEGDDGDGRSVHLDDCTLPGGLELDGPDGRPTVTATELPAALDPADDGPLPCGTEPLGACPPDGWFSYTSAPPSLSLAAGTDPTTARDDRAHGDDHDGDGLTDDEEREQGSDPWDMDTDDDALTDREEIARGLDPSDPDSDDDLLPDGLEVIVQGTDPSHADTDGDGLTDGGEVLLWGTDPLTPDTRDWAHDTDRDGLTDDEEERLGTEPDRADSDGDRLGDGHEVLVLGTDPLVADTDRDGRTDGEEVLDVGSHPLDGGRDLLAPYGARLAAPARGCGCTASGGTAGPSWALAHLIVVLLLRLRRPRHITGNDDR